MSGLKDPKRSAKRVATYNQSPLGKGSNLLIGTADQITENLKRLKEEIMPKVDAM